MLHVKFWSWPTTNKSLAIIFAAEIESKVCEGVKPSNCVHKIVKDNALFPHTFSQYTQTNPHYYHVPNLHILIPKNWLSSLLTMLILCPLKKQ